MRGLIIELHNVLTLIKGFEAGHTTKTPDRMLINHDGKTYRIIIEEMQTEEHISDGSMKRL